MNMYYRDNIFKNTLQALRHFYVLATRKEQSVGEFRSLHDWHILQGEVRGNSILKFSKHEQLESNLLSSFWWLCRLCSPVQQSPERQIFWSRMLERFLNGKERFYCICNLIIVIYIENCGFGENLTGKRRPFPSAEERSICVSRQSSFFFVFRVCLAHEYSLFLFYIRLYFTIVTLIAGHFFI